MVGAAEIWKQKRGQEVRMSDKPLALSSDPFSPARFLPLKVLQLPQIPPLDRGKKNVCAYKGHRRFHIQIIIEVFLRGRLIFQSLH